MNDICFIPGLSTHIFHLLEESNPILKKTINMFDKKKKTYIRHIGWYLTEAIHTLEQ